MASSVDLLLAVVLAGVSGILAAVAAGAWSRMRTRRGIVLLAGFAAMMAKGLLVLALLLYSSTLPLLTYMLAVDCAIVLLLYAGLVVREVRSPVGASGP